MAVAARKIDSELRYAPATRVYSQGAAAPALAPEAPRPVREAQPRQAPKAAPAPGRARVARAVKPRPQVSAGRLLFVTLAILAGAALLIILLVRYAMISQDYAVVNGIKTDIEEIQREIDALNVELSAAVSLEDARAAALEAGMGYPTAEQIIRIQGAQKAQAGGQAAPE